MFNDQKRKDTINLKMDVLKARLEEQKLKTEAPNTERSPSTHRSGGPHGKTFDIFVGGRYLGPRTLDYNTI
jgi:hypothetical protein